MLVTKVTRTYSKSINTKNYGVPESWIRIEATYESTCESGDDPTKVSQMMYDQAKKDVIDGVNSVVEQIRRALNTPVSTPAAPQSTGQAPANVGQGNVTAPTMAPRQL